MYYVSLRERARDRIQKTTPSFKTSIYGKRKKGENGMKRICEANKVMMMMMTNLLKRMFDC